MLSPESTHTYLYFLMQFRKLSCPWRLELFSLYPFSSSFLHPNFSQCDPHSSFKSQFICSNKPTPSPKPMHKFIFIELQTSNTINLQTKHNKTNKQTTNNRFLVPSKFMMNNYLIFWRLVSSWIRVLSLFSSTSTKNAWH